VLLFNFAHRRQRFETDCLVACAAMVLAYLGINRSDEWLIKLMETTAIGTPFSNIDRLKAALGLGIERGNWATVTTFEAFLEEGLPIIVAVDSDVPAYWPHYRNHAVVVVGFNADEVYINNPAVANAPEVVDMNTFLWAWSQRGYEYAVVRLL
jgi:ABC-type bacteriocin/lantibiotic exporter with double-glycine peptidase domain